MLALHAQKWPADDRRLCVTLGWAEGLLSAINIALQLRLQVQIRMRRCSLASERNTRILVAVEVHCKLKSGCGGCYFFDLNLSCECLRHYEAGMHLEVYMAGLLQLDFHEGYLWSGVNSLANPGYFVTGLLTALWEEQST